MREQVMLDFSWDEETGTLTAHPWGVVTFAARGGYIHIINSAGQCVGGTEMTYVCLMTLRKLGVPISNWS